MKKKIVLVCSVLAVLAMLGLWRTFVFLDNAVVIYLGIDYPGWYYPIYAFMLIFSALVFIPVVIILIFMGLARYQDWRYPRADQTETDPKTEMA